ncbi:MAG: alpha/beta hydrolase [Phycisphaerales bacterium]|jgi:pimeloyl-ACP methyl ester carboxylesterase
MKSGVPKVAARVGKGVLSLLRAGRPGGIYHSKLGDERALEPYRSLMDSLDACRVRSEFFSTGGRDSPTVRIATEEFGARKGDVIVFIHGVFADRSMWRFVAGAMAPNHNLLLLDLPGCGESDKPRASRGVRSMYSPEPLARRVLETLREHLRSRHDAPRLRIVAHSLGGAIAIRMFASPTLREDFRDVLDRIDGMVLLAPLDVAVEKEHPTLTRLLSVSGTLIWSAKRLGTLRNQVASTLLANCGPGAAVLKREADHKMGVLTHRPSRKAMQAMLYLAVPRRRGRPVWSEIDPIVARYCQVAPRTLIIWGEHDEVLPVSMGYKLAAQLPDARLTTIPKGGHSLVLEQPALIAKLAHEFFTAHRAAPSDEVTPDVVLT